MDMDNLYHDTIEQIPFPKDIIAHLKERMADTVHYQDTVSHDDIDREIEGMNPQVSAAAILLLTVLSAVLLITLTSQSGLNFVELPENSIPGQSFAPVYPVRQYLTAEEFTQQTDAVPPDMEWAGIPMTSEKAIAYYDLQNNLQSITYTAIYSEDNKAVTLLLSTQPVPLPSGMAPEGKSFVSGVPVSLAQQKSAGSYYAYWKQGDIDCFLKCEGLSLSEAESIVTDALK